MHNMSLFQEYIYLSRYSRFLHSEGRRELWPETVKRYFDFFTVHLKTKFGYEIPLDLRTELETAVLNFEVMPSMRCVMTAGPALERENIAGYNCSYIAIDHQRTFSELLYILMNGTGVGFSIERQYVQKLPEIPEELYETDTVIVVHDSKLGWAKALNELISLLYTGLIPHWDVSKLRPAGAILKTFGGRSSGPGVLVKLFSYIVNVFKAAKGRKLTSLECHDICCMIGECVVVGGVRRSALLSLSNLSDDRMRNAKNGQWWVLYPHRSLANNSAVYNDPVPTMETYMTEWKSLYDSKSGERGFFSRYASKNLIERSNTFRKSIAIDTGLESVMRYRNIGFEFGSNPCSEIILRANQFCNLSEAVVRVTDTIETLKRKVQLAAILGTFQSTLTDFRFIGKKWINNTEDERLLGVSLTGIMDNTLTNDYMHPQDLGALLTTLKRQVILTNIEFARKIGIEPAVATTCVKPSGTVSALVDSASGIHARHAEYYIRTARSDIKDPLTQLMIDQGFYYEKDVMRPDTNVVFYFPTKSPEGALHRDDLSAIDQLNIWKIYQLYWCVSGDTQILTENGNKNIKELLNKKIKLWNGFEWSECEIFSTGKQKLYNVVFSNGSEIKMTNTHKIILKNGDRIPLKDCKIGDIIFNNFEFPIIDTAGNDDNFPDAYSQGFYSGDGYTNGDWSLVYVPKKDVLSRLIGTKKENLTSEKGYYWKHSEANVIEKTFVPFENSLQYKLNWLAGLIDADGNKNNTGIDIVSNNKIFIQNIQMLLTTMGVKSHITFHNEKYFEKYLCKSYYSLYISGFYKKILIENGLKTNRVKINEKNIKQKRKLNDVFIKEIIELEEEETFCFTENLKNNGVFNGILTGQCEHKPSVTISVKENEWMKVGAWVYDNFDILSGVSFLPHSDHNYEQAPFQDISEDIYEQWLEKMPKKVDWSRLSEYETTDQTTATQELACTAGAGMEGRVEIGCSL